MYRLYGLYRCIEREETTVRSPKKTASVRLFGHIQCIVYIVHIYIYVVIKQILRDIYIDSRERNQVWWNQHLQQHFSQCWWWKVRNIFFFSRFTFSKVVFDRNHTLEKVCACLSVCLSRVKMYNEYAYYVQYYSCEKKSWICL
jgi:hypothetical protein